MLDRFKEIFAGTRPPALPDTPPVDTRQERLKLATCVVLIEVASADDEFSAEERDHILTALAERFSLSSAEAEELLSVASRKREESVDLWQFTHQINELCKPEEKIEIIEEVWRVICADHAMDGHEDHLAHKLAKLFNLTHRQLIDAKVKVLDEYRG